MRRWSQRIRKGMGARTYAWLGVLIVVLVWVYTAGDKTRSLRTPVAAAPLATVAGPPRAVEPTATPPGWGEDPFQRW